MGEVIGIRKPNTKIITQLESLTREARNGSLTSIVAIVIRQGEPDFVIETSELNSLEIIGAIEVLKKELIDAE